MKAWLHSLLAKAGRSLLPATSDPVLMDLLAAYRELRLRPDSAAYWQHRLSRTASLGHLRDLLRLHRIGCVIDVGANTGQFGQALRRVGFRGRIVSFEPMDQARRVLERVASIDGSWEVVPAALGRERDECELQVFSDDTFSSLHPTTSGAKSLFPEFLDRVASQKVRVERLDDLWSGLFRGHPECPVLLKTDTQGHDLEVLHGAGESLREVSVVLSEASIERIYEDSPTLAELAAHLEARGFRASGYYPFSHRQESLAMIELDAFFVRI